MSELNKKFEIFSQRFTERLAKTMEAIKTGDKFGKLHTIEETTKKIQTFLESLVDPNDSVENNIYRLCNVVLGVSDALTVIVQMDKNRMDLIFALIKTFQNFNALNKISVLEMIKGYDF